MKIVHPRQKRRGATAVEAAIVLPLLIMLTFGAIKYGWIFYRLQQATHIARQAARLAIRPSATDAAVITEIDALMTLAGMPAAEVAYGKSVSCQVSGGSAVTVTLTLPKDSPKVDIVQFNGPIPLLPNLKRDMTISVTMNKEGPP